MHRVVVGHIASHSNHFIKYDYYMAVNMWIERAVLKILWRGGSHMYLVMRLDRTITIHESVNYYCDYQRRYSNIM